MKSIGYKSELNRNGDISLTFIKPLKRVFNRNIKIFNYFKVMQLSENNFVSLNKDNVQYTWTDNSSVKVKSLHYKKNCQMFLKENTILQRYFFFKRNKDWTTNNVSRNLRYRHTSTCSQNDTLSRLEESYRILEKNLSSLIVKELKKQDKLKPHQRTWITESLIEDSIDTHLIFKIWVPKLVHLRQFLTSLRVAIEFIPTLNLDLDLGKNLEFNSLMSEFSQKLENETIKDEEIISYLKHIQSEAYKLCSNFNKISIKAFCEYPQQPIYNKKYEPEYVVRKYVEDHSKWNAVFKDICIENTFNSLVHKIHAVDLLYKTSGKHTPGVDNIKFWKPIHVTKTKIKQYKNLTKLKTLTPNKKKLLHELYTDITSSIKLQHPAIKLQSVAKGKSKQAIQRKGSATTPSEKIRATLNSTWLGKQIKSLANQETKLIKKDPLNYINNYNKLVITFNTAIKFDLINHTKFNKLKNFKSNPILRIYIPKTTDKFRPLGIPTLKDRYVQKFMSIIMEPYLEPCGDKNSWGFRPGRSSNHAITNLAQILAYTQNNPNNKYKSKLSSSFEIGRAKYRAKKKGITFTKEYLQSVETTKISKSNYGKRSFKVTVPTEFLTKKTNKKKYYLTKYILDANIKGCFDKILHEWLLENTPLPKNYKHLLFEILKTTIVEKISTQDASFENISRHLWLNWDHVKLNTLNSELNKYKTVLKSSESNAGIPQGGSISPILMNWTLDGLSQAARIGSVTDESGKIFMNKKNLDGRNYSTNLLGATHLIRFADDFIFTSVTEQGVMRAKKSIETFLKKRGLTLNAEKTQIIKWTMGKKLNFLDWTFHLISPNKINWLTDLPKNISRSLKNRTKLYVYPSRESTKSFKNNIKDLLSLKNTNLTPQQIIKKLNPIIWEWSNYFLPSPNQYTLRSYLDHYIFKRCKQWIFKKYTQKGFLPVVQKLLMADQTKVQKKKTNKWKRSMEVISNSSNQILKVKVLRDLAVSVPMWQIKPSNELKQLSMFLNPEPYLRRAVRISSLKGDTRAILLEKQEFKCAYCKNKLIEFNTLHKWSIECDSILESLNVDFKDTPHKKSINKYSTINLFDKVTSSNWYSKMHVDHVIPKILAGSIKSCKALLDDNFNKVIIHHECHKLKTKVDHKLFISELRNIKKELRKKFKDIDDSNERKYTVDLYAMDNLLKNKDFINNYLKYIKEIYGETKVKYSHVLVKKLLEIIKICFV